MQALIYLMFGSVMVMELLDRKELVPRQLTWTPELLSVLALLLVVLYATRRKVLDVRPAYVILFAVFATVVIAGIVLNAVGAGTAFTGLRVYFKHLPFFLIPVVFAFSEVQVRRQLLFLLALALVQLPVALYQRFIEAAGVLSGDPVRGTLINSSGLSVFLICAMAIVWAFYLRKRISRPVFWMLLLALFVPTTLNETKGTFILLPVALLVPALFVGHGRRLMEVGKMAALGTLLFATLIPVYDHFMQPRWGYGIVDFFTTEGYVERYLAPSTSRGLDRIGRVDALMLPFQELSHDPPQLMLGVGIGNASESFLGHGFHGAYFEEYGGYVYGAVSNLLWEVGVIGTLLLFTFLYLVWRDALALSRHEGMWGALGLGWAAVVVLIGLSLFYRNLLHDNAIWYLMWYFSGLVVGTRWRLALAARPGAGTRESAPDDARASPGLAPGRG